MIYKVETSNLNQLKANGHLIECRKISKIAPFLQLHYAKKRNPLLKRTVCKHSEDGYINRLCKPRIRCEVEEQQERGAFNNVPRRTQNGAMNEQKRREKAVRETNSAERKCDWCEQR